MFLQSDEELNRVRSDEKNSFNIIEDEKNLVSVIPGHGKNSFSVERKSLEIDVVFPMSFCPNHHRQGAKKEKADNR